MLGIGKAIPTVIKEIHFSTPEHLEIQPAIVGVQWKDHPVRVETQSMKAEDIRIRRHAIMKRVLLPHSGLVNVTMMDESRPFEFRPSAEAVAGGARELVMKRNGDVPISELCIFVQNEELDTYATVLEQAFDKYKHEDTREAAQILTALVDGNYEPFYLDYCKLIHRPAASPSWASRSRYQGNAYWKGDLIDPPDLYLP